MTKTFTLNTYTNIIETDMESINRFFNGEDKNDTKKYKFKTMEEAEKFQNELKEQGIKTYMTQSIDWDQYK